MSFAEDQIESLTEELATYHQDLHEIIDGVSNWDSLSEPEQDEVRGLYKTLKQRLAKRAKQVQSVRWENAASHLERNVLGRAISDADSQLVAKSNSNPKKSNWVFDLLSAQADIVFYLQQLRDACSTPQGS